jgi:hypothetical protein
MERPPEVQAGSLFGTAASRHDREGEETPDGCRFNEELGGWFLPHTQLNPMLCTEYRRDGVAPKVTPGEPWLSELVES